VLDQLAKNEPDNTLVLGALARKSLRDGTPQAADAAMQYLSRASKAGSTSVDDYRLLANLLARSGRFEEAVEAVEKAISLDPYAVGLYKSLAYGYLSLDKPARAIQALKEGLQIFPQDADLRSLMRKAEAEPGGSDQP